MDVLLLGMAADFLITHLDIGMSQSVLEAIREGKWDYEPDFKSGFRNDFSSTLALPGTEEKVATLAERAQMGLPLWHPEDRRTFDDTLNSME